MKKVSERKPNLFIAGAAKAGTTSLYFYLSEHPDIFGSNYKEPRFYTYHDFSRLQCSKEFINEIIYEEKSYFELYKNSVKEKYIVDGSVYIVFFKNALKRIKKACPNAKIIISIRNPIDRLYSHYKMQINMGVETRNFKQFLENPISVEGINYIELGLYFIQIKSAFETFGEENVMVIKYEDFIRDTKKILGNIYDFLNIDRIYPDNIKKIYLKSDGVPKNMFLNTIYQKLKPLRVWLMKNNDNFGSYIAKKFKKTSFTDKKISDDIRNELFVIFKDDIEKTEELTGFDLSDWKMEL